MGDGTLKIDFVGGALGFRLRSGGGGAESLRRAVGGWGAGKTPVVVDATAGLGRDGYLLASMGARVTLIERSPEVHAQLRAALERAAAEPTHAEIVERITLLHGDAQDLLPTLSAEVVLVDPMHPPRRGTALVKAEMRVLRQLVGADADACELMQVALASASKRVVLKWPLHGEPLPDIPKPSHQILGKTTRYDVFMVG